MCSARGKGHVVLPICWLQPDPVNNAIDEETEEDTVKVSVIVSCCPVSMVTVSLLQGHKYMIEATIMRDSWPSTESAWSYINMLKNVEKLEDGLCGDNTTIVCMYCNRSCWS